MSECDYVSEKLEVSKGGSTAARSDRKVSVTSVPSPRPLPVIPGIGEGSGVLLPAVPACQVPSLPPVQAQQHLSGFFYLREGVLYDVTAVQVTASLRQKPTQNRRASEG